MELLVLVDKLLRSLQCPMRRPQKPESLSAKYTQGWNNTRNSNACSAVTWASLVAQTVKNLPEMQETWVESLVWKDPLEEGMATPCSILVWRIPWTEEPGGLQSLGLHRVRHNWMTNTSTCLRHYLHVLCVLILNLSSWNKCGRLIPILETEAQQD